MRFYLLKKPLEIGRFDHFKKFLGIGRFKHFKKSLGIGRFEHLKPLKISCLGMGSEWFLHLGVQKNKVPGIFD